MITQAIDPLAEFAYNEHAKLLCRHFKQPVSIPCFADVDHEMQDLWSALVRDTLKRWVKTEFVAAMFDDDFMEGLIQFMKGDGNTDEPSDLYRNAVSFFVVSLINPKMVGMARKEGGEH